MSSTADAYLRQLSEIDAALKRHKEQTKILTQKKKETHGRLAKWMEANGYETYGHVKLVKIKPREPAKRKPAKQKKEDALRLFSTIGVNDPESLWEEFQRTQKIVKDPEPEEMEDDE